ncbi:hypothetical protein FD723_37040 (plasmid) [Nostoc sp. C052]|uniref:hypothetical protein n=1 Tax=Nostoc sp. C052 TaxID=2576902 RepID=UPI0015C3EEF1|nr:hypothetical protein [Nostoc sp. C052]QLE45845.1 hypothetical protein FD723_37040 [Nostoc sp. C052]
MSYSNFSRTTSAIVLATLVGISMTLAPSAYAKRGAKKTQVDDRHNITHPHESATRWLNTMKQTRVAELFGTKKGLVGHVQQIQNEINRVNKNLNGKKGQEVTEYITALKSLRTSIIASAKGAKFDFNKFDIQFSPLGSDLSLARQTGKLSVDGRPVQ